MIKIGYLVPVAIIKSLPTFNSYLTLIANTEVMALLPKKYAGKALKVGDSTLVVVHMMEAGRVLVSQKSPQFFRKLTEHLVSSLLLEGKVNVKHAAAIVGSGFAKVAVESCDGCNAIKACVPYMKKAKHYTDDTITLVRYSADPKEYAVNALVGPAPADGIKEVLYFRHLRKMEVYVEQKYLGWFVGKGGANVATAAKLTGVEITVRPWR